jgi:diaminohydroxyphosphoribosylaminopyrimidine deaminase/5-amino-6-(5-phosphoribosylamino)uracil reductase
MSEARAMLDLAARLGLRGFGHVEPNPMVGCVLVGAGEGPADARVIGMGHHRAFGGAHAEAEALAACRAAGRDPRGSTTYVTLEPCNATGRNGACSEALIAAGVARVVYARTDPNPLKSGGAERLRAAGIACELSGESVLATRLSDPFIKRVTTDLPWVIAKWAQTIDGKIATRQGESQWISGPRSRRRVHLLRGRVDAIVTGLGTARTDNPVLTAREVPLRRVARRVIVDPTLALLAPSAMRNVRALEGTDAVPTTLACVATGDEGVASAARVLSTRGVEVLQLPSQAHGAARVDLAALLRHLRAAHGASTVLIEAGPRLVGSFMRDGLVDECLVFVGPTMTGDVEAPSASREGELRALGDARRWALVDVRACGADVAAVWRKPLTGA